MKSLATIAVACTLTLVVAAGYADASPAGPAAGPASASTAGATPTDPAPITGDFACLAELSANGDLRRLDHCGRGDADGRLSFDAHLLKELRYGEGGPMDIGRDLGVIRLDSGQWFYVRRDGKYAPARTMDGFPDGFSDERARSPLGGKVGYVDRNLNLVIPARFDGAFPFKDGWAVVCIQCQGATDGEHHWYIGGLWGCIDPQGRERAPLHPFKEGGPFETCGRKD